MKKRLAALFIAAALVITGELPMSQVHAEEAGSADERTDPSGTAVDADYTGAIDGAPTVTTAVISTETQDGGRSADAVVEVTGTLAVEDDSDPDALFAAFVDDALYDETALDAASHGNRLSGVKRSFYRLWREAVASVASGETADTELRFYFRDFAKKLSFTYDELGLTSGASDDEIAAALAATAGLSDKELGEIYHVLLLNCPYELYWQDKTSLTETVASIPYTISEDGTAIEIDADEAYIEISMPVSADYAAGKYETDTARTSAAVAAANKAQSVAAEAAALSDTDKLAYYRDWILANASYGSDAYDTARAYGDPWQLIYVFDGDPTTNVVCEGYAKAFKYLCDITSFNGDVSAQLVTGRIGGLGSDGASHMWNVVTMTDGTNYIVDLTNYNPLYPNDLFLSGYYKTSAFGYVCKAGDTFVNYSYDSRSRYYYTISERYISAANFGESLTVKEQVDSGVYQELVSEVVYSVDDPEYDRYFNEDYEDEAEEIFSLSDDAYYSQYVGIDGGAYAYPAAVEGQPVTNGIDVSHYQGGINWGGLKARGVGFAIIRVGYRSTLSGALNEDAMFRANIQGAYAAGIPVGVYFFSQATNPTEAAEEANYCAALIAPYRGMISLPVFMDYEYADSNGQAGRLRVAHANDGNNVGAHTDTINTFCGTIAANGYSTGVYTNRNMFENCVSFGAIGGGYHIWLANYTNATGFGGRVNAWQYTSSFTGFADLMGSDRCDMDFWFGGLPGVSAAVASGGVGDFVTRLYVQALGRDPEPEGHNYWSSCITSNPDRGNLYSIALNGFLHSEEFMNKNLDDGEYVRVLYRTFLGREAEEEGFAYWTGVLASGGNRDEVARGFAYSQEFSNIMAAYGL